MTITKQNANVTNSNSLKDTFGSDFQPLIDITYKKKSRKSRKPSSVLTIINTENHGKRILINSDVIKELGSPNHIQIGITSSGVILGIIEGAHTFELKEIYQKKVIYSAGLVDKLTKKYKLNFSGKTSHSYQSVSYRTVDSHKLAYVKITNDTKDGDLMDNGFQDRVDTGGLDGSDNLTGIDEDQGDLDDLIDTDDELDDSDDLIDTDDELDDSDDLIDTDDELDDSDSLFDTDDELDDSDDLFGTDDELDDSDSLFGTDDELDDSDSLFGIDDELDDSDDLIDTDDELDDSDDLIGTDDELDDSDDLIDTDDELDDSDDLIGTDDELDDSDDLIGTDDELDDSDGLISTDDELDESDNVASRKHSPFRHKPRRKVTQ